jgi:hypothetical protein
MAVGLRDPCAADSVAFVVRRIVCCGRCVGTFPGMFAFPAAGTASAAEALLATAGRPGCGMWGGTGAVVAVTAGLGGKTGGGNTGTL